MAENFVEYTLMLGETIFKGVYNNIHLSIYDLPRFIEEENTFKENVSWWVNDSLKREFGLNCPISFSPLSIEFIREKNLDDGFYYYKNIKISFRVNDLSLRERNLYTAINPNFEISDFMNTNSFFKFVCGNNYEEKSEINGYAKISDIFLSHSSTYPNLLGFHGMFAPIKTFKVNSFLSSYKYSIIVQDWHVENNMIDNFYKCVWPGFAFGLESIMNTLYLKTLDLHDKYNSEHPGSAYVDTVLSGSFTVAPYRTIQDGNNGSINTFTFDCEPYDLGHSFLSISKDIYAKPPVVKSPDIPSGDTISGNKNVLLNYKIESNSAKETIESSIKNGDFEKELAKYFSDLNYQGIADKLEDERIPYEIRKEVLDWYVINGDYLNSVKVSDFSLNSYKIVESEGKRIVEISVKTNIDFTNVPSELFQSTAGTGAITVIGFILAIAKLAAVVGVVAIIAFCPWINKIVDVVVEVVEDTPESMRWIWPLVVGAAAGWGIYLLFKKIFKKR